MLRDDYIEDTVSGIKRWNKVIEKAGLEFRLTLPHKAFHCNIGPLREVKICPDGVVLSEEQWTTHVDKWLPSEQDRKFATSLMGRVVEPGKYANWMAPLVIGINRQPG